MSHITIDHHEWKIEFTAGKTKRPWILPKLQKEIQFIQLAIIYTSLQLLLTMKLEQGPGKAIESFDDWLR